MPILANPAYAQDACETLTQYPATGSSVDLSQADGQSLALVNGAAPTVHLENCASVQSPIVLKSEGPRGSDGGNTYLHAVDGGQGGGGGGITITNQTNGTITATQDALAGLGALSIGGDGGNGSTGHFTSDGGNGGLGGNGADVTVANAGTITTSGQSSAAMYGLSQGGEAGNGGSGGFLSFSSGGTGGAAGNSGASVTGFNSGSLTTSGTLSSGMSMHSIGGRGGEGGSNSNGFYAVGGNGGPGGIGGDITVTNQGSITTTGNNAKGISALSIGGGGGDGGSAFAAGLVAGVAIGGYGGGGGYSGSVTVENDGAITTSGYGSLGIRAQSVGGGGGDGGSGTAVAAGSDFSFTFAMGGSGGNGGDGGNVSVTHGANGSIVTGSGDLNDTAITAGLILPGDNATGILAQSIGGGGGNGHQAFSLSGSAAFGASLSASVALGGSGGNGGKGGDVTASSAGSISTNGRFATGMLAQSVGGGGGNGGNTIAIDATVSNTAGTVKFALAGAGGAGNSSGTVTTTVGGTITTIGQGSSGVVAQSIAGGGGNGGNTFDTSATVGNNAVNLGVSMGGSGGSGAQAGTVSSTLQSAGTVETYGDLASALIAQSIGGGGGNGGSVQTYAVSVQGGDGAAGNVNVDLGGSGGNGGVGGTVQQTLDGSVTTAGHLSAGTVVQSIGGGGGNGGHVFALDVAASLDSADTETAGSAMQANVAIGGDGAAGANGQSATLNLGGTIQTSGELSAGALVQSIGGGGGNGGSVRSFSTATALPSSLESLGNRLRNNLSKFEGQSFDDKTNVDVAVNIGGTGGGGGAGGDASAILNGATITTDGGLAAGLIVQSIGGGGGTGGDAVADGFIGISSKDINVGIGGHGGTGASAGTVTVQQQPGQGGVTTISTSGDQSYGVLAQSIGGGGGAGGSTHAKFTSAPGLSGTNVSIGVGGSGGTGNLGGNVLVRDVHVTTAGSNANAIVAQSIGGGGGSGNISDGHGGIQISLGGSGGSGNNAGTVGVMVAQAKTTGVGAAGVLAQSIGGGGGNSGLASMGKLVSPEIAALGSKLNFNVAGSGGNGGDVNIGCATTSPESTDACVVSATTTGNAAVGIMAQSIGGGGGLVQVSNASLGPVDFAINGPTPGTGSSGRVSVTDFGTTPTFISTSGQGAIGILAQSIDSGGGTFILDTTPQSQTANISSSTSVAGNGGVLVDLSGRVNTTGDHAVGILAQSLSNAYVLLSPDGPTVFGGAVNGNTNNSGSSQISLRDTSSIYTSGGGAHGLMVQTGSAASAATTNQPNVSQTYPGYGAARAQTIDLAGTISVSGQDAWGIYSTNLFGGAAIPDDQFTTHITVEQTGQVSAGQGTAGGIYIQDSGNVALDVSGSVYATGGTAISVSAGSQINMYIGSSVYGDVTSTVGTGSDAVNYLSMDGSIDGMLTMKGNGGSIKIDGQNGSVNAGSFATALSIDTTNADIVLNGVHGNIVGPSISAVGTGQLAKLSSVGYFAGSIDGAFNYQFGSAFSSHGLNVSGTGGPSDHINVGAYQAGGPGQQVSIILTSLPNASFQPYDIISVASGMPSSGTATSLFGLVTDTLATRFDVTMSFPSAGAAVARLNGISVDFTRAGLTGNFQQISQLANAQVQAFANGQDTAQADAHLLKYLLLGAIETNAELLQDELTVIEPSLHYGTAQSDAAAIQAALNDMQSCGDATLASVDPIAQGECNWAKYLWRGLTRLGGAQRERTNGVAMGRQFAIGGPFHLGLSAVYEDTRFRSATAHSNGGRIGFGSILKFNNEASFASLSGMGSYSWAKGSRVVPLAGADEPPLTATARQKGLTFTTRLRGGHRFDIKPFDLIALADADLAVVHDFGYTEDGAGSLNLKVASNTNVLFDLHPAVQLGSHTVIGGVHVRAYGEFGYRFSFGDIKMPTGLANGYDAGFLTNVISHHDKSLPTYGAGMILDLSDRLEVRVNYDLEKGDQDRLEKFSAKFALKF